MSIQAMLEKSREYDERKSEYLQPAHAVRFNQAMEIEVPASLFSANVALTPTDWAIQQVCQKLTVPYSYMQRCPPRLEAVNLNYWRRQLPQERMWLVRGFDDKARAVLSDRYLPIGVTRVLEWTNDLGIADNGNFVRPYMDPDSLHLKIKVLGDPEGGNYAYGVYIREGEIGNYALGVYPFVQRISCENSIIFDTNAELRLRLVHMNTWYTLEEARAEFKMKANRAMKVAVEQRDAIAQAEAEQIEDFSAVVERLCRTQGFTEEVKDEILLGTEGERTVMGLVNGVSAAAKSALGIDEQVRMETIAGNILVHPDSLFGAVGRLVTVGEEV